MIRPGILYVLFLAGFAAGADDSRPPNIVYILADDMGRGDLSAYNADAAWRTPNLDRLAREGAVFTDAHSGSAVCTPSRYCLLTGRYAWRTRLKEGVLFGYGPPLVESGRLTVPALLRRHGYATAMVGKWHLGLTWPRRSGAAEQPAGADTIDWEKPVRGGPTDVGFDSFFGIAASLDMPPYVWIRDDRVVSPPVREIGKSDAPAMWRAGPIAGDFDHADVQSRFTREALAFLARQDAAKPFFLYLAFAAPHTPIVPDAEFAGRTGSPYGDFCLQLDRDVGKILSALDDLNLAEISLVVFTADNGCSPIVNFADLKALNHDPQPGLRGAKADIYDGGHRVPFLARWPGHIPAGTTCSALVAQQDLLATCAEILGSPLPPDAGEDSVGQLATLRDPANATGRDSLVHHSINGSFAIRRGKWKLCLTPDSGGWSRPTPGKAAPDAPPFQLFDLTTDPGETSNVFADHLALAADLAGRLRRPIESGRSTPGPAQPNAAGHPWPQLGWTNHPALNPPPAESE